ncbi:botulinum neurotoxin type G [Clostridium argentinense CDC 2741]|uniref:Botulinum neurotoxin type G n=2 Tax=Clostridium argentinense TaxID=29341 RepID=A0A0C1TVZ1_9CLOT|nr:botulinum neurotoxin type G [Clostridium argentinense]ARC83157.1 peptidase M27 [Clostridium argentinense]KIE44899.1 botulinum neurotoxin type G [Clostridium argentinense CDC 2741]NFF41601.1 botulinum neurotoxin type G [Clostridium argentinense]NFP52301.1 botulinum neurotoxin type G [Clostridium argentinense]NFP74686.1 botulinum neurotoxin type G [Clostridium argentinense]
MPVNIKNFNYNDPINNDDIIMMEPFNDPGPGTYYKAFRIIDRIWIVPERFTYGFQPDQFNASTGVFSKDVYEYYDPTYLKTDAEKDKFLKTMIKLFNRINSKPSGQRLLDMIVDAIPYLGNASTPPDKFAANVANVSINKKIIQPGAEDQIKGLMTNLIIFGPGPVLSDNFTDSMIMNGHSPISEGFGARMMIRFCPSCLNVFNNVQENKDTSIFSRRAYFADPALTLMHELIHVLHGLYGIKISNLPITPNTKEFFMQHSDPVQAEELYTFGGHDPSVISPSTDMNIYNKALQNFQDIANRLNIVSSAQGSGIDISLYKQIYKNKYDFVEDPNGKYSVDKDKFDKLYKALMFGFTETNLAGEYGIKTRYSYFSEYLPPIKTEKLLDNTIYTQNEGFNIASKNLKTEFNGQNKAVNKEAYEEISLEHLVIYRIAMCKPVMYKNTGKSEQCIIVNNEDLFFIANKDSFSKDLAKAETIAYNTQNNTIENNFSIDQLILDNDLSSGIDLPNENTEPFTNFDDIDIPVYIKQSALKKIFVDGDSLFEYLHAQTFPSNIENLQLTNSLNDALRNNNKVYTFFSTNLVEKANTVVGASLFVNWVKGVIDDFTSESTQKSTIDKVSDVSIIIPYIGPALNVGNETAKENFKNAFEIGGAAILMEFIPELIVPIVGFFTLESYVGNKGHIIMTISNALKKRDQKWTDMYGLIVSQWLSTVNTQFYTIKERMYNALNNQSQAIEKIIEDQYNRYSEEDKMNINIDFNDIDFKLNQSINLAINNIDDFINQCSISYLMNRMIPLAVKKLKDFDDNLKRDLLEYIDTNELYLLDEVNILKSKVNRHLKDSIPFDLSLYTKDTILIQVFNNYISNISSNAILSLSYRGGRLIDSSGYGATMNVGSDVIFNDIGNGQFKLNNSENSNITAHQSKFVVYDSMFDNFSINFWVRTPKYNNNDIQTYLQNEYTIISCIKNDSGWKVSIKGNRIIWTLIDVNAKSKSIFFEYSIKDNISDYINKWFSITITNDRLGNANIYINGSLKKSEKILNLDRINSSNDIDFKLINCTDTTKFVWIKDFNIFGRELNATEVSSLYWIQSSTNTLKDFWGNPLRYDTQYYLFNQGMQNIYIKYFSKASMGETAPRTNFNNAAINYQNLYLGLRFIIKKASNSRNINNDNIVREGDYIYLNIDNISDESYRVYVLVNSKEIQTQLFLAPINDDPTFYDVLQIKKYYEKTTYNCQILCEKDTKTFGLFGIGKFVKDYGYVWDTYDNYFCISQWYLRRISENINKLRLGCNWQFIPVDEGWTE